MGRRLRRSRATRCWWPFAAARRCRCRGCSTRCSTSGSTTRPSSGWSAVSGDAWFARDSYRRFLTMFAGHGAWASRTWRASTSSRSRRGSPYRAIRWCSCARRSRPCSAPGTPIAPAPTGPRRASTTRSAPRSAFRRWCSATAARTPGTGVVFTRDPATGEPGAYGDYLPRAQGEDVVAGSAQTLPIDGLAEHDPAAYDELMTLLRRLEIHYRDVCDVEFTVEEGRLWLLQTRIGKRGAVAAVRIAAHLVDDPDIRLTPEEALERVPPEVRERARRGAARGTGDEGAAGRPARHRARRVAGTGQRPCRAVSGGGAGRRRRRHPRAPRDQSEGRRRNVRLRGRADDQGRARQPRRRRRARLGHPGRGRRARPPARRHRPRRRHDHDRWHVGQGLARRGRRR